MSGPIVRTGTTPKFWENYDRIFKGASGKKSTEAKKETVKAEKKATEKKVTAKKSAKKAAAKKKKK